jgi:hypothetical protein
MNDKEKNYWYLKLNSITEKETIILLEKLIREPLKFQKDKNKNRNSTLWTQNLDNKIASSLLKISDLKSSGISTILLKSKIRYKEKEHIKILINTMGKIGYLYIIYKDKENTMLLYPNAKSPLTKLNGEYQFPRDFGNMTIVATKDCKDCKKEETTLYVLLTKVPIDRNIYRLTGEQLSDFIGIISLKKSKKINENEINMYVGRVEFYVE